MNANEKMSYHMHNLRKEIWTVISGKGEAILDGIGHMLSPGDVISIAAGCKHTIKAITNLSLLELQMGDEIVTTDKYKFPI